MHLFIELFKGRLLKNLDSSFKHPFQIAHQATAPKHSGFSLQATLRLPPPKPEPKLYVFSSLACSCRAFDTWPNDH